MFVSIVIPVFNESKKITVDLEAARSFLKQHDIEGEIIVVDDGSTDETAEVINGYIEESKNNVALISYRPNRGKGYAVKTGILKARGDILIFIDSGNCVPYDNILPAIRMINEGKTDIAHASRFLKNSVIVQPRNLHRRFLSWSFREFICRYAHLPDHITDSQCGLKVYRGKVAKTLYSEMISDGFLFDIEIILRADKKGYKIIEFPIIWTPDADSRLNPLQMGYKIWPELRKIKRIMSS
jgi:dolichyl-phosphate beta-glucosyltransferase